MRGVDLSKMDLSDAGWLIDADLRYSNLSSSNLSRSNLQGARLERANLEGAYLIRTNLDGADLRNVRLTAANLKLVSLQGAFLQGANLVGAVLTRANLQGANLEAADLEGANLQGADLRGAKLGRANLKMTDFKGANLLGYSMNETDISRDAILNMGIDFPSSGFAGALEGIRLPDLLQVICHSRIDLLLDVKSSAGGGAIYVFSGRVCHAEADGLSGEEAFHRILQWDNGRFEALPLPKNCNVTIDKSIEHLLVESFRQLDEMSMSMLGDLSY